MLSIAFVLGVTSIPARADDVYQPKNFPTCKVYKVVGIGEVCGFLDIEDWKKVLAADAELVHAREKLKNEESKVLNLAELNKLLHVEVDAYAASQKLLVERNSKLTQDLIDLDKKYQGERVKPRFGSPVAWTIAGVSAAILVGFVSKSLLD